MALKIIFMGTPAFAVPILKSIHESEHNIICVYTQPAKKKNRGLKKSVSPVHLYAKKSNLKVITPENFNNDEEYNIIKNLKADVAVVVAYGKILPEKVLSIDTRFINVHASILPKWRGAAPIQRAIMNLDKETGISIMKITKQLDAGPVMLSAKINISRNTTFEHLSKEMSELAAKKILEALDLIEKKTFSFVEQNSQEASYANKIDKKETKINWNDKASKIVAKINALYPNPGAWFNLDGKRIKVIKAVEVDKKGTPGEILDEKFTIACEDKAVQIIELQKESKNKVTVIEFLKGNKLKVGNILNV